MFRQLWTAYALGASHAWDEVTSMLTTARIAKQDAAKTQEHVVQMKVEELAEETQKRTEAVREVAETAKTETAVLVSPSQTNATWDEYGVGQKCSGRRSQTHVNVSTRYDCELLAIAMNRPFYQYNKFKRCATTADCLAPIASSSYNVYRHDELWPLRSMGKKCSNKKKHKRIGMTSQIECQMKAVDEGHMFYHWKAANKICSTAPNCIDAVAPDNFGTYAADSLAPTAAPPTPAPTPAPIAPSTPTKTGVCAACPSPNTCHVATWAEPCMQSTADSCDSYGGTWCGPPTPAPPPVPTPAPPCGGKFQLIKGLPCCEEPDDKGQYADWWEDHYYAKPVASTKLPIVILDTLGSNPSCGDKVDTEVKVIYDVNGGANKVTDTPAQVYHSNITRIRIAGQSSRGYRKKQFNIYLKDSKGMLDLPKQEDFRLLSIIYDQSALKNWLVFNLDRCNGAWSSRMRFVRAYLVSKGNDDGVMAPQDMGLYALVEKIKKDGQKLDITKKTCDTAPDCGYILQLDRPDQVDPGNLLNKSKASDGSWCIGKALQIEYPGKATQEQAQFLQGYLDDMCKAALTDDLFNYIDAESFYNQFVYNQLSMNVDSYISSEFFHKDQGGKIKAGPQWDLNGGFQNNYESAAIRDPAINGTDPNTVEFGWYRNGDDESQSFKSLSTLTATFGWSTFLKNQKFVNGLICHYQNLRKFNMTDGRLWSIIDQGHAFLKIEGAADSFLPHIDLNVAKLKNFVKARAAWMDANIEDYKIGLDGVCPDYTPPGMDEMLESCETPDVAEPIVLNCGGAGQEDWSCDTHSEAKPTAAPTCANDGESCAAAKCCQDASKTCIQKDEYWASCRESCTPGIWDQDPPAYQTPWSCKELTPTDVP